MTQPFIGLDVSKDHLDIGQWPDQRTWRVPNTATGIAELSGQLRALAPACIVRTSRNEPAIAR